MKETVGPNGRGEALSKSTTAGEINQWEPKRREAYLRALMAHICRLDPEARRIFIRGLDRGVVRLLQEFKQKRRVRLLGLATRLETKSPQVRATVLEALDPDERAELIDIQTRRRLGQVTKSNQGQHPSSQAAAEESAIPEEIATDGPDIQYIEADQEHNG